MALSYSLPRLRSTTIGFKPLKPLAPYKAPQLASPFQSSLDTSWKTPGTSSLMQAFAAKIPGGGNVNTGAGTVAANAGKLADYQLGAPSGSQSLPTSVPTAGGSIDLGNYLADPVLQQIISYQDQLVAQKQAAMRAAEAQLAIDYGSSDFAKGLGLDTNTVTAAGSNPYSILSQLGKANKETARQTDQTLNKANLFFGSERARQMGLNADYFLQQQTDAQRGASSGVSQLISDLLDVQNQAVQAKQQAQWEAYNRALQMALMYGVPSGGSSSSSSSTNEPAGPPPAATAASWWDLLLQNQSPLLRQGYSNYPSPGTNPHQWAY